MKPLESTASAAEQLGVHRDTVNRWIKAGNILSYRTIGGHFRIPHSEIIRLIRQGVAQVEGQVNGD